MRLWQKLVFPFQHPIVTFSFCTLHLDIPIICKWHLQLVQIISCSDRHWSALNGCLIPIWLQESQTQVSAPIHFWLLFWIPLYYPGGPHSMSAGSQFTVLAVWDGNCNTAKANPKASLWPLLFPRVWDLAVFWNSMGKPMRWLLYRD